MSEDPQPVQVFLGGVATEFDNINCENIEYIETVVHSKREAMPGGCGQRSIEGQTAAERPCLHVPARSEIFKIHRGGSEQADLRNAGTTR